MSTLNIIKYTKIIANKTDRGISYDLTQNLSKQCQQILQNDS